jgi:hypothetical protein
LGLASALRIRLGQDRKQRRRNESADRLVTYPYDAGMKFTPQPQNNSRFFAYLFLSRSGLKKPQQQSTDDAAVKFFQIVTDRSKPY